MNSLINKVRITKGFFARLSDQVDMAAISFGERGEEALEALRLRLHVEVDEAIDKARRFSDENDTMTMPTYHALYHYAVRHRCDCEGQP